MEYHFYAEAKELLKSVDDAILNAIQDIDDTSYTVDSDDPKVRAEQQRKFFDERPEFKDLHDGLRALREQAKTSWTHKLDEGYKTDKKDLDGLADKWDARGY